MTLRELDQLVSRTSITPVSKRALKDVRRAVQTGFCSDPTVGGAHWSVAFDTVAGMPVRMTFSFQRDK